jgi:hypothetical protein
MVATESNRLPSFKNRRTLSPLENEQTERKTNPDKKLLGYQPKEKFFVDIPFYRTIYLTVGLLMA